MSNAQRILGRQSGVRRGQAPVGQDTLLSLKPYPLSLTFRVFRVFRGSLLTPPHQRPH